MADWQCLQFRVKVRVRAKVRAKFSVIIRLGCCSKLMMSLRGE